MKTRKYQNLKTTRGSYHPMNDEEVKIQKRWDVRDLYAGEFNPESARNIAEGWGFHPLMVDAFVQMSKDKRGI